MDFNKMLKEDRTLLRVNVETRPVGYTDSVDK